MMIRHNPSHKRKYQINAVDERNRTQSLFLLSRCHYGDAMRRLTESVGC